METDLPIEGTVPQGFRYIPGFQANEEGAEILDWLRHHPFEEQQVPRVWRKVFATNELFRSKFPDVARFPPWAQRIADRLHTLGIFEALPPDYLFVLRYEGGQGIYDHIDIPEAGPVVAGLTLGSTCVFTLQHAITHQVSRVLLSPGSLYVLQGEARTDWSHSIPSTTVDTFRGTLYPRGQRTALTFREWTAQ